MSWYENFSYVRLSMLRRNGIRVCTVEGGLARSEGWAVATGGSPCERAELTVTTFARRISPRSVSLSTLTALLKNKVMLFCDHNPRRVVSRWWSHAPQVRRSDTAHH